MRRMLLAGAVLMASYGTAAAQVVIETVPADVYVAPSYSHEYYYRSSPRVYSYTPRYYRDIDDDDVVVVEPRYRRGCGVHGYWNGDRCIYVRY